MRRSFGLDAESVRAVNPRCVTVCVSAFGSSGPDSNRPAYDLIGQALSGLLLADPRPGDTVPRRTGGLALADFTAGLLAALAVTAGLLGRSERAPDLEVSLLGAALALQAQRFVEVEALDRDASPRAPTRRRARARPAAPSLRRSRPAPTPLRRSTPTTAPTPAPTASSRWRASTPASAARSASCSGSRTRSPTTRRPSPRTPVSASGGRLTWPPSRTASPASACARPWRRSATRRVPASEVRSLGQLFDDAQVRANGLVQTVEQRGVGPVRLLGSPFKVDGAAAARGRPAPALGEHADELLGAPARR